jgi:hypothetical protein
VAKVTEKDIVEYLNEKISFHRQEAQRLEGVLGAFTQIPATVQSNNDKDAAPPNLSAAKPARRNRTQSLTPDNTNTEDFDIPDKYSENLNIHAKIAFALKEIGSGLKEDIANTMAQYEPRSDADKIIRQISTPLANLKAQGKIDVEKIGRKNRFKLA